MKFVSLYRMKSVSAEELPQQLDRKNTKLHQKTMIPKNLFIMLMT